MTMSNTVGYLLVIRTSLIAVLAGLYSPSLPKANK
jgi:hypothetical protein